jgi:uncharacterized protein YggE
MVSRQVQVELRDLEQLGTLLERAVTRREPGERPGARLEQAQGSRTRGDDQGADAKLNAETLARAAGVKLGPVRALNASASGPVVPLYKARMAMAADAAMAPEATYQPGEMKFSANVSAEYDLVVGP